MPTKIDKLWALEALYKKVREERDLLKDECAADLLEAYRSNGDSQRKSPFFGKESGALSVVIKGEVPEHDEVFYRLADAAAFAEWCAKNTLEVQAYATEDACAFAEWLAGYTGEVPEGIERVVQHFDAEPEHPSGTRLSVKYEKVIEKIGDNLFEQVNALLLEGGD